MEYDHIRKLLNSIGDEKASKELSAITTEFKNSSHWTLVKAVLDHMISQNLRAGKNGLEEYGRVQGINSVLDFFDWIVSFAQTLDNQVKQESEPVDTRTPTQGGYGLT